MNERIRELAKDAHDFAFEQTHRGLITNAHRQVFEKKFAELIIRECAEISFHNVVNLSSIADAKDVEANIKEHFGVE